MKRAFAAVAMAAAALSVTTLAVATATSPTNWAPQAQEDFRTFTPFGFDGGSLDPTRIAATDPTAGPTASPASPKATPSPAATRVPAADRPALPSLPAVAGGATVTKVVITPRPTPRPVPVIPPAPAPVTGGSPSVAQAKAYALSVLGSTQYSCIYQLFMHESGWNPYARNRSSGAYGIPQALPGYKMATAGADWATNPVTQVKWGISYVAHYGGACAAWSFWQSHGWY